MTKIFNRQLLKLSLSSINLKYQINPLFSSLFKVSQTNSKFLRHSGACITRRPSFSNQEKRQLIFNKDLSNFSTSSLQCAGNDKTPCEVPKLTLYQRFKQMYKEYWYVLVPVHVATSIVWYGGFYYMAVSGVDVIHLLEVIGIPESWIDPLKNSKAGPFVSAYTMYKIATPARYTVTVGGTTVSINYLKKWGWIKPIPNKEKLKEMYQERRDALRDIKDSYQDKLKGEIHRTVIETKDEFKKTTIEIKKNIEGVKDGIQRSKVESKRDMEDFKFGAKSAYQEWAHFFKLITKAGVGSLKNQFKSRKKENE